MIGWGSPPAGLAAGGRGGRRGRGPSLPWCSPALAPACAHPSMAWPSSPCWLLPFGLYQGLGLSAPSKTTRARKLWVFRRQWPRKLIFFNLGWGPFEGSRQVPVLAAVLPWAGQLTSLSLSPRGPSRGMLQPSLLQRVVSAGRDDVYMVLRCVRSQAVMAAHGCHPQRVAVGFRKYISSPILRAPPLESGLPAQVPSSDREPPS